jgi:lipopolysaccharide/colanic/teichoic acid biosynthesis glycosyltransferase
MKNEFSFSDELKDIKITPDQLKKLILKELNSSDRVLMFVKKHFDFNIKTNFFTSTATQFNIEKLPVNYYSSIINLKKINDARFINQFFEAVNLKLPNSGLYFGKVETFRRRRKALLEKYPPLINRIVYVFDYFLKRVLPKLKLTRKIYFYLTKGKGRVISKAETYGRLYSCGFEIIDEKTINNALYFVAKKIKEPSYDKDPTYGSLIRLKRIGKDGNEFKVYKLRTMHPFSEYLQEYVYKKNKLQNGGKIKADFRISPEGRVFRKIWLDEIPMIYNLIKGDMKIVGVRPLSSHFFSLYEKDLQDLRIKNKPGLIPPFYADMPITLEEIMASEMKYLKAYQKSPLHTDFSYFFKALYNILIKRKRSS